MQAELLLDPLSGTSSVKGAIVGMLAKEWPMTAKQIHSRLVRENAFDVTYQGVFKAVKGLETQGVLVAADRKYSVNPRWLSKVQAVSAAMTSKLQAPTLAAFSGSKTVVLPSLFAVDKFLLELAEPMFQPMPVKPKIFMEWSHFWIPLFFGRDTYNRFARFPEFMEAYCVSRSNSKLDQGCADYWRNKGVKVALLDNHASGPDFIVIGDLVIQVYYPVEAMAALDTVYGAAASAQEFDADALFRLFEQPMQVPVVISRDAVLAEHLTKQVMRWVGK